MFLRKNLKVRQEGALCGRKCNSMFSHFEPQLLPVTVELRGQRSRGGKGQEKKAGVGHKWVLRTLVVHIF